MVSVRRQRHILHSVFIYNDIVRIMKRLFLFTFLFVLFSLNASAQTKQFLLIEFTPKDATLEIDGEVKVTKNGVYQELLPLGEHSYKLYQDGYIEDAGVIYMTEKYNTKSVYLSLMESHVIVRLKSDPKADILINGNVVGTGEAECRLSVGTKYKFESRRQHHTPDSLCRIIQPSDNNMTFKIPYPDPILGKLMVTSNFNGVETYLDGEYIGETPFDEAFRVLVGTHTVTVKYKGYEASRPANIEEGEQTKMFVNIPYGSLAISSQLPGIDVYINEEPIGTTPIYLPEWPVGEYKVKFYKNPLVHQTYEIKIEEGESKELYHPDFKYGSLYITSDISIDDIIIDGFHKIGGVPPAPISLNPGNHCIGIIDSLGVLFEKEIYITAGEEKSFVFNELNKDEFIIRLPPKFQGGPVQSFSKWVNQRLVYPEIAKENGIQGKVTIRFTIETDGSVTNVNVLKGVDPALDKEAVRVASSSPRWTPAKRDGSAVPVTYTFPVIFQLR